MIGFAICVLVLISFVLLCDLIDLVEGRYAVDVMQHQPLPDRWVVWGLIDPGQTTRWVRYFALKLPSYSYEYRACCDDYAMGQAVLLYVSGRGWRRVYVFE